MMKRKLVRASILQNRCSTAELNRQTKEFQKMSRIFLSLFGSPAGKGAPSNIRVGWIGLEGYRGFICSARSRSREHIPRTRERAAVATGVRVSGRRARRISDVAWQVRIFQHRVFQPAVPRPLRGSKHRRPGETLRREYRNALQPMAHPE